MAKSLTRAKTMKGNQNSVAIKDPDIRKKAYKQYCDHIASGLSKVNFYFEHPDLTCTYATLEKYIAENPSDFDPIHREIAEAKSYQKFETACIESALGDNPEANTASLQMIMRNKFKWDKIDHDQIATCAADKILERINKGHS